jgi:hypothetical protein
MLNNEDISDANEAARWFYYQLVLTSRVSISSLESIR